MTTIPKKFSSGDWHDSSFITRLLEARPKTRGRSGRFDLEGIKHTCRAFLASVFPTRFGRLARRTRK